MADIRLDPMVCDIADLTAEKQAEIILRARRLRAEAMAEAVARLARWISDTYHHLFDTSFGLPKTR